MSRTSHLQPSFNAGELSPRLSARSDFAKFHSGLEECLNAIPLPEGGLARRPGTRFVAAAKTGETRARLGRFQFSTSQAYVIEMGAGYFRFYRHQGRIEVAATDAAVVNGAFTDDIAGWVDRSGPGGSIAHDAARGMLALVSDGVDPAHAEQAVATSTPEQEHVLRFRIDGAPGDGVRLRVGTASTLADVVEGVELARGWHTFAFTPGVSPFFVQFLNDRAKTVRIDDVDLIPGGPVEIATPYGEDDLAAVEGPQAADVLYLFHPLHPPYRLERRGHASWSVVEAAWRDGPYLRENDTETTLTPAAVSGAHVAVTASAAKGINGGKGFGAGDVGRLLRLSNAGSGRNWGWGRIKAVTSPTEISVAVERNFATTAATKAWRLGSWSATTGWPRTGAFFEQRLACAGSVEQPQTFWLSQTGDFENMAPDSPDPMDEAKWDGTVEDDDALDYTISADDVNAIQWMSPGEDTLAIGTSGGEWLPRSSGAVLTPTDITVRRQTTHGSAPVRPLRVGNVALFVQKAGRKVREFAFNFEADGFIAHDMTRLSQHVTKGGIVEMAYQQEPDSVVWAVRGDGVLLSMTYRREEDVVGWARHVPGGRYGDGPAEVESVAVVSGADGPGQVRGSRDRDELWLVVRRTVDGETRRMIEVMERDFETGSDRREACFVDALVTYRGEPTDQVAGLDHLEGETVAVLADGAIIPPRVVSGGAIALKAPASVVQVGLPYRHRCKTLRIEGGAAGGALGKLRQIAGVTLVLLDSHKVTLGPGAAGGAMISRDFRAVSDPMDAAAPLFSGEQFIEFPGNWDTDSRIVFEGDEPTPFTLLAMAPEITTNERL